jgi:type II secretion system protein G
MNARRGEPGLSSARAAVPVDFPGRCLDCGYRLCGLSDARCPECGRPFEPTVDWTFTCESPRGPFARAIEAQARLVASAGRWIGRVLPSPIVVVPLLCVGAWWFVVPKLVSSPDCTRLSATAAMVGRSGNIAMAINLFRTHVGRLPTTLDKLTEPPEAAGDRVRWEGPYIEDPGSLRDAWQRPLRYASPGKKSTVGYDLWSVGPDGEDGTGDDIGNWRKH